MNKPVQAALVTAVALAALAYAGPVLIALARALVPLVLVVGAVVAVLQLVRYFTQR